MENSGSSKALKIIRNGADTTINISGDFLAKAAQEPSFLPIGNLRPIIGSVVEDSPANDAGIKVNDIMLRLNNIPLHGTSQVAKIINSNSEVEIPLTILRGSDTVFTSITPGIDGTIGIGYGAKFMGEVEYENYSLFASVQMGFVDIVQYVVVTFEYMTRVISGQLEVGKAFGGPVKIAQIAADSADMGIIPYLKFLAILSLSLAIFNMLPLPVVDGGHFVIILIEGILRREIPIKIKIAIQNAGFILLLMLMAFIIYSDIINL
jgi:regulator of sigma E protease